MAQKDIITFRRYADEYQAEMARATLEAHGIPAIVSRDDCGGMEPYLHASFGARLLIHHGNAIMAVEILDHPHLPPQPEDDQGAGQWGA